MSNAEILAAVEDFILAGAPSSGARELAARVTASSLPEPGRSTVVRLLMFASKGTVHFPSGPAGPLHWLAREFPSEVGR
jgi:hypothetical protein